LALAGHDQVDQARLEAQWYIHQAVAWIKGKNKMSVVLFVAAIICGFVAGRVSARNTAPKFTSKQVDLQEQLTVAQNLNESLLVDLQEAKETIRKLKNANKNKYQ
jgi:hypothetical protein